MKALKTLFSDLFSDVQSVPRGAADARAYAVGDVHGRLDLLDSLLEKIEADAADREPKRSYLVFLGDLIDRGPDSRGVLDRLLGRPIAGTKPIYLMGNHEEVMLRILTGEEGLIWNWLRFGGAECVASYGVDPAALAQMREGEALRQVQQAVPARHRRFLAGFADTFSFGDYLFVHAGIRPGVPLEGQQQRDLRWIREPFLTETGHHGQVVVHGHTIVDEVEDRGSRIAIDTGAYRSGVLTAIAIEDDRRWFLATGREAAEASFRP